VSADHPPERRAAQAARQLALGIRLRDDATFETYRQGPNALAVALLEGLVDGGGEPQAYLWGARGSGRTHLLQAACQRSGHHGGRATYLPLAGLRELDPAMLEGLEALDLVAIDDVDAIAGLKAWEHGLFDLINRLRSSRTRLVMAAAAAPAGAGFALPDLSSRLGWGPVFQLRPLSETDRRMVVRDAAARRGLDLSGEALEFLMTRSRRDLASLLALLDRLDEASLVAQRRLTIPFIRDVLEG
jgi:DnaA family protein